MVHTHCRPIAITFTGGVDSTVLCYWLLANADKYNDFAQPTPPNPKMRVPVYLLSCNYGQANWPITKKLLFEHTEILQQRFPKFTISAITIEVALPPWVKKGGLFEKGYMPLGAHEQYQAQSKTYEQELVSGRNAFLFLYMLSWMDHADVQALYTGHQQEVNEWDNLDSYKHRTEDFTPMFLDRMNLLQEVGFGHMMRVEAPFSVLRLNKYEICRLGQTLQVDVGLTYSCQYLPPCGKCDNCIIRRKAFGLLNIEEKGKSVV